MQNMTHYTKLTAITTALLITFTGCRKTADSAQPIPGYAATLNRIQTDGDVLDISYNAGKQVAAVTTRTAGYPDDNVYTFSYSGGLLSEVTFGGKWKYYYNGDKIVRIETLNEAGVVRYQSVYSYTGDRITEKIESRVNGVSVMPFMKTEYSYYASGDLSRKQVYQYINSDWKKTEEVVIDSYDNHMNITERFESFPFLPGYAFASHNPLHETWKDDQGQQLGTVEYEYTYDSSGRVATRKRTNRYNSFPDEVSNTTMFY